MEEFLRNRAALSRPRKAARADSKPHVGWLAPPLALAAAAVISSCQATGPLPADRPFGLQQTQLSIAAASEPDRIHRIAARIMQAAEAHCADAAGQNAGKRGPCRFTLVVENSSLAVAAARGDRVRISTGLSQFAASDAELAFVIGHEAGHVLLGHEPGVGMAQRRQNELDADRLGATLAARAGYDPAAASGLLERMARSGLFGEPQPSFTERAAQLRVGLGELRN